MLALELVSELIMVFGLYTKLHKLRPNPSETIGIKSLIVLLMSFDFGPGT